MKKSVARRMKSALAARRLLHWFMIFDFLYHPQGPRNGAESGGEHPPNERNGHQENISGSDPHGESRPLADKLVALFSTETLVLQGEIHKAISKETGLGQEHSASGKERSNKRDDPAGEKENIRQDFASQVFQVDRSTPDKGFLEAQAGVLEFFPLDRAQCFFCNLS